MSDLRIEESDEWYKAVDADDCVVAQFVEFEDLRWFINFKRGQGG